MFRIVLSEKDLMNKMNTMTQQTGIWSRFKTAVMQPSVSEQSKYLKNKYFSIRNSFYINYIKQKLDLNVVKKEISALEEMARQLFLEIVDLKRTIDRINYSKTFQGRYFNFLGCK